MCSSVRTPSIRGNMFGRWRKLTGPWYATTAIRSIFNDRTIGEVYSVDGKWYRSCVPYRHNFLIFWNYFPRKLHTARFEYHEPPLLGRHTYRSRTICPPPIHWVLVTHSHLCLRVNKIRFSWLLIICVFSIRYPWIVRRCLRIYRCTIMHGLFLYRFANKCRRSKRGSEQNINTHLG